MTINSFFYRTKVKMAGCKGNLQTSIACIFPLWHSYTYTRANLFYVIHAHLYNAIHRL